MQELETINSFPGVKIRGQGSAKGGQEAYGYSVCGSFQLPPVVKDADGYSVTGSPPGSQKEHRARRG